MSIATMVALGVERQKQSETRTVAAPDADTTRSRVTGAMEKVAAFIPSEVVGIYVAGFGILSPKTDEGKWWIFGICLALIPVLIGLNFLEQTKKTGTKVSLWIPFVLMIFALIAFVAWAAALPGTPFLSLTPNAMAIGGWSVVILAIFMYKIADLLDIVPSR